jgi:uncharacterized protein (TIGR00369 family)
MSLNPFQARPTFVTHTGIELTEASADRAVGHLDLTPDHHQPYGAVHGGVYTTLIETLASTGAALWAMENGMGGAMGVSNTTDFFKAVSDGRLVGVATPIHRGRTQQLWEVAVTHEETDRLVSHGQVRLHNVSQTEY